MQKKKYSISDIARELGISTTTVSFILNGKAKEKRISDGLVKKVQDFVVKIDYKPNTLARSLRTGRTNIIGLMVEDISNPFFSAIARAIEEKSYQNGYKIIYCSTENDTSKTQELINMYKEWHVDGYIIVTPKGVEEDIKNLKESGKPVVLFDRYLPGIETDSVIINNQHSAYHATKHLIKQGFKHIAFITIHSLQLQMQDRLSGYTMAIEEYNLPLHIHKLDYKEAQSAQSIVQFLKEENEIDAILFATNYLCVTGLKALKNIGAHIPEDIGVVSFDNYELFEMHTPTITAIAQPVEQIAEKAIGLLLTRLKEKKQTKNFKQIMLPTSFIARDSSKRKETIR